jgi:hypothetical protein
MIRYVDQIQCCDLVPLLKKAKKTDRKAMEIANMAVSLVLSRINIIIDHYNVFRQCSYWIGKLPNRQFCFDIHFYLLICKQSLLQKERYSYRKAQFYLRTEEIYIHQECITNISIVKMYLFNIQWNPSYVIFKGNSEKVAF